MKNVNIGDIFARMRPNGASRSPEQTKMILLLLFMTVVFFAAATFSMWNFIRMNRIEAADPGVISVSDKASVEAAESAKALNMKVSAFRRLRAETPQMVATAESTGRAAVSVVKPSPKLAEELKVPEFTPEVRIKALAVHGDKRICTLDIEGEEPDLLFKPGMTFGGGKGMIVSIDTKGVNWKWANKNHRTEL